MAKLPRKTQKIFCSKPTSENQTSVFGTMKTADKQYSTDVGTLQSNAAYEQGWKSATIANYKPFMEDFNTLNYINTSQLAYLFQQGIPEWDEATAYYKNSFCSYNGDLWQSLIDDNLGNAPFEGDEWTLFSTKNKGGGLELCDIGTALYVDETQGLRRRLNGSIMDITTNYQAFLARLLKIKDTNPDYFTTEANWQAEKAMNIDGCVYKFVLNYDSTGTNVVSVRLPKYPDYIELNDLSTSPSVSVAGNGKPLRLTNGATTGYLSGEFLNNGNNGSLYVSTAAPSLGSPESRVYVSGQVGVVTDASLSGLTGTINATTTKLKLIYFIQVATGQETENNIVNDIELNNPFTFGMSQYYKGEMNNISWLKSYGQWNSKAIYPSFYNWAFQQLSAKQFDPSKITVVGSPTITDDGIASGFSGTYQTEYIKSYNTINTTNADNMRIEYSFTIMKAFTQGQMFLLNYGNSAINGSPNVQLYGTLSAIQGSINSNASRYTSWEVGDNFKVVYDLQTNKPSTYTLFKNDVKVIETSGSYTDWKQNAPLYFYGNYNGDGEVSIYLSQCSISVDGKEVYSPTKRLDGFKRNTENYDDYDFVINTTDETFRLPLKNGMEGVFASGVKGNGKALVVTDGNGNERNLFQPGNDYIFTNDNVAGNLPHVTASYSGNQTTSYALGTNVGLTTDPTKSGIVVDVTVPSGYNLYYYVGETVQNANLIDAGRIGEQLAGKLDRSDVKAYITETYQNGTSWYRVWSNGWCEQGGIAQVNTNTKNYTVNLLKAYKDIYYNISCNQYFGAINYANSEGQATYDALNSYSCTTNTRTISSFRLQYITTGKARFVSWQTCGYAKGEN